MKSRLIRQKGKLLLLLPDGTVAKATEGVLKQLFVSFANIETINGKDGRWDADHLNIEDVKGKTLAWVDDKGVLCIKENPFTALTMNKNNKLMLCFITRLISAEHIFTKKIFLTLSNQMIR